MRKVDYKIIKNKFDDLIYATITTDIEEISITFSASESDYEKLKAEYLYDITIQYNQHTFLEAFKKHFISGICDNLTMTESAIRKNVTVFYNYDLMGCFEVIRVNRKTVTVIDITNRKHYLTHEERKDLTYEEHTATHCKHYNPQITCKCHVCYKELNTPVYDTLMAIGCITGDEFPVCSTECKNTHEFRELEAENELMKQIEELENNPID
jgi:hypothetical protein